MGTLQWSHNNSKILGYRTLRKKKKACQTLIHIIFSWSERQDGCFYVVITGIRLKSRPVFGQLLDWSITLIALIRTRTGLTTIKYRTDWGGCFQAIITVIGFKKSNAFGWSSTRGQSTIVIYMINDKPVVIITGKKKKLKDFLF